MFIVSEEKKLSKKILKKMPYSVFLTYIIAIITIYFIENYVDFDKLFNIKGHNFLVVELFGGLLLEIFIVTSITLLLTKLSLCIAKDEFKNIKCMFPNKMSSFLKLLIMNTLITLIVWGGMLLLIVPGIIWSLNLSQSVYILAEDESKSIGECLKESAVMMKGNRLDYFFLPINFIGYCLLSIITLGIGLIWFIPLIQIVNARFYLYVSKKYRKENCNVENNELDNDYYIPN